MVSEGNQYLAFRLPRFFRKAGWKVDLLCLEDDPMRYSRYVDSVVQEKDADTLFHRTYDILHDPNSPWQTVSVIREDIMRRVVATGDAGLWQHWQPGMRESLVREFVLSKFGLAAVYKTGHLKVPPGQVCQSIGEIKEFGQACGWPIIVKPPLGSGGGGVMKFSSLQELESKQASLTLPILVQKFIRGQRGLVDMLCSAGRPLIWLASYSTKKAHGEFGPSTARLFHAKPQIQSLVHDVASFTKFEGFCGFDWIEEEGTGEHYLIEFHPRAPSGLRFGPFCGVDFSAAIAAWLRGEGATFPTQVQSSGRAIPAHYFTGDLLRCFRERDWQGLKAWLPGSGACHDVYWDDPSIFLSWVVSRGMRWGRQIFLR